MLQRLMGKASFATIADVSGQIQLCTKNVLGDEVFDAYKHWDLGDIIWAKGKLFKTQTNELSVKVQEIKLLTKSLRPLPDKFHGVNDQELRYRQRFCDLIVVKRIACEAFTMRSKIVSYIRNFFTQRDFSKSKRQCCK